MIVKGLLKFFSELQTRGQLPLSWLFYIYHLTSFDLPDDPNRPVWALFFAGLTTNAFFFVKYPAYSILNSDNYVVRRRSPLPCEAEIYTFIYWACDSTASTPQTDERIDLNMADNSQEGLTPA